MAVTGFALAQWVAEGLPWQWAVASVISISASAAALFEARVIPLFSAKIAIWSGFAIIDPTPITVVALAAASLGLMLVARLQWTKAEQRRLEREARSGWPRGPRISCAVLKKAGRAGSGKPTGAGF
ncbi:MAG: hypothetical protein ACXIT4_09090 [Erythrobacter sp.]